MTARVLSKHLSFLLALYGPAVKVRVIRYSSTVRVARLYTN